MRHKLGHYHTWDGVPLGYPSPLVDLQQADALWRRKHLRKDDLARLTREIVTYDRRVTGSPRCQEESHGTHLLHSAHSG